MIIMISSIITLMIITIIIIMNIIIYNFVLLLGGWGAGNLHDLSNGIRSRCSRGLQRAPTIVQTAVSHLQSAQKRTKGGAHKLAHKADSAGTHQNQVLIET